MASPNKQLAQALKVLDGIQSKGQVAIHSNQLGSNQNREQLIKSGYIEPLMRGWYISRQPEDGEAQLTATWFGSFWEFCADYLEFRFGENWSFSPAQSLLLHCGNWSVPQQLIVRSPTARNKKTSFPHSTDIFEMRSHTAVGEELEVVGRLRLFKFPYALVHTKPKFFKSHAGAARAAIGLTKQAEVPELLELLTTEGHVAAANRLAGAFRSIACPDIADQIMEAMEQAGYTSSETRPFKSDVAISLPKKGGGRRKGHASYSAQLHADWQIMREGVIRTFPEPPGLPGDTRSYLKQLTDNYATDAYNSLTIEGYQVTEKLVERSQRQLVKTKQDSPTAQDTAMAARGYSLAFNKVKTSVEQVLKQKPAGEVAAQRLQRWQQALLKPHTNGNGGQAENREAARYRRKQVLSNIPRHHPPKQEAVREYMPALFDLLATEEHAGVRAVLGHWAFIYIYPYTKGNGQLGRFLMNVMLASGGYPWLTIPARHRADYHKGLEIANSQRNIETFSKFLGKTLKQAELQAGKLPEPYSGNFLLDDQFIDQAKQAGRK